MVIDSHSPNANPPDNCPICNRSPAEAVKMQNSGVFDGLRIECPQCGRYELVGVETLIASSRWGAELRCALSCAARQATEAGRPLRITSESVAAELAVPHMHSRVSDNRERLLSQIAKRARRPSVGATFTLADDFTLIDCYSKEEFIWYIEWLKIEKLAFQTDAGPTSTQLTLSLDGWNQVQPLPRTGGIPGQCFVAMWFSEDTRAAYEQGIEPAVSAADPTGLTRETLQEDQSDNP
jgi:hypothetical protein